MDIYKFTKEHLNGCKNADLHILAEDSGIPYHTILKIKSGETKNPGVLTIQAIANALKQDKAAA